MERPCGKGVCASVDLGRILVSGANGHLGQRLIRRLASDRPPRATVRAIVRSERAADTLRALPEAARAEIRVIDYADASGLASALKGCHSAVHLVGILKETLTRRYGQAHESTTTVLARLAADEGMGRIVYLSILGADPQSKNPCLASKGRAEQILLRGEVPTTVLRVPMVLGPGDVAARALRRQALAKWLLLVRGGASLEQPIYADDLVEAIVHALAHPLPESWSLDLAGPESLSHRRLVERAAAVLGARPRVVPVPLPLARLAARISQRLFANPPVTPPMLGVLERDDCVDPAVACARLGLTLTPLDEMLRRSLSSEAAAA